MPWMSKYLRCLSVRMGVVLIGAASLVKMIFIEEFMPRQYLLERHPCLDNISGARCFALHLRYESVRSIIATARE